MNRETIVKETIGEQGRLEKGKVRTTIYIPIDLHTRAKQMIPNLSEFVVFHLREHLHTDYEQIQSEIEEIEHILEHKRSILKAILSAREETTTYINTLIELAKTWREDHQKPEKIRYYVRKRLEDHYPDFSKQKIASLVTKVMKAALGR